MRARKVDANLGSIVDLARKLGFLVYVRNDVLGDLDVQMLGKHECWEVKAGAKKKYTQAQKQFRKDGWLIRRIESADDVLLAHREIRGVPFK